MTIGIVGIVVALSMFMVLVYKGVTSFVIAPICAVIVAVTNSLGPTEMFYLFAEGVGDMMIKLFAIIFLGIILGRIYTDTKGAAAIAKTLAVKFVAPREGNNQIKAAILIMIVVQGVLTLGGIDGFVLTFTTFPIAFIIAEMAGIPRRFIPSMLVLNTAFMACPGSPQIINILMVTALTHEGYEVTATSGMIPGLVGVAIILILGFITLTTMIIKAKENGENFDPGDIERLDVFSDSARLPNFYVALIPLFLVFMLYSITKLDIVVSLASGNIAAVVLMGRYFERGENESWLRALVRVLNSGASQYPNALATVATPSGLATVVTSTAAFGVIVTGLASLNLSPIMLALVVVCVIVALTSAPPVALFVGLPIIMNIFASKGINVNPAAIGRVAALAAITFESLPVNGMCVLTIGLAKSNYKKSYLPIFTNTVVYTFLASFVCALIYLVFPNMV